ncbi:MAG: hypothetical protein WC043_06735 [Pseudobdellovibrionaceae bacterium]
MGKKPPQVSVPRVPFEPEKPLVGTNGALACDVLVLKQENKVVLVVDHDFTDRPEWVEWDVPRNVIGVAQVGGAVAEIGSVIPPEKLQMFRDTRSVYLSTRFEGRPVAHMVYLVIRE